MSVVSPIRSTRFQAPLLVKGPGGERVEITGGDNIKIHPANKTRGYPPRSAKTSPMVFAARRRERLGGVVCACGWVRGLNPGWIGEGE